MELPPRAEKGFEKPRDMPGMHVPGYRDEDKDVDGVHAPSSMPVD